MTVTRVLRIHGNYAAGNPTPINMPVAIAHERLLRGGTGQVMIATSYDRNGSEAAVGAGFT
ncbi:MAG TPA: hypothetical protein VMX95_05155 [Thermodesulfobacteriota bacterium]|nr:hypothetical protein [Thermodesulfobacteriota bacterium]